MDIRSGLRTILTVLVGLGVVVLIIIVLIKAISGFTGGSGTSATQVNVGKYSDSAASASFLVDDAINNDQDHRQLKITVSGTQIEADVIQGYQGTVIDSRTYPNNSVAFDSFLQSLKLLNFAKGSTSSKLGNYTGYCPTGERYIYTFNDGSKDLFSFWSTSCGQGTFGGNAAGVRDLFEQQILASDFDTLTNDITLGS
jgi:hypothetical protein